MNEPETESLNVRVPVELKKELDRATEDRGFNNRSEYVRFVLRNELEKESELTTEARERTQTSREQAAQGELKPLEDVISDLDIDTTDAHLGAPSDTEGHSPTNSSVPAEFQLEAAREMLQERDISIIGCGGAGISIVNRYHAIGRSNATTFAFDVDRTDIKGSHADTPVRIGRDDFDDIIGVDRGNLDEGSLKQEAFKDAVKRTIGQTDLVFVIAGLGGNTGTYLGPRIADIAQNTGSTVIGVGSLPFEVETHRVQQATRGIEMLRQTTNSLVLLDSTKLATDERGLPYGHAIRQMNNSIASVISRICRDIHQFNFSNGADSVHSLFEEGQLGSLVQFAGDLNDIITTDLRRQSQYSPLRLDDQEVEFGLFDFTVGSDIQTSDVEEIVDNFRSSLDSIAWTTTIDGTISDTAVGWIGLTAGIDQDVDTIIDTPESNLDYEIIETPQQ